MNDNVDILLAVFNAEVYLKEQLASIYGQSHQQWHLVIRDDGSTDGSPGILLAESAAHPSRIRVLDNGGKNLGASQNFARLMLHSTSRYIMFCDQDDIWLPHKMEATLAKMQQMEQSFGTDTPILVHTDLKVADENLRVVSESLWQYQLSDPDRGSRLNRLLMQNVATGCSMMINRPLLDMALPVPGAAMMHDWWLALVAAAFGKMGAIHDATALYRQHGANDTGAKKWDWAELARSLCNREELARQLSLNRSARSRIHEQAAAFLQRYEPALTPGQKDMLEGFIALPSLNFFMKRYNTIKYGFYYTGLARNIARLLTN